MKQNDAIALIEKAINPNSPQSWADLGCGNGTFTMALNAILPVGSQLVAVDKRPQKLPVGFLQADFEKDDLHLAGLDGILMANSLHFVKGKAKLIRKLETYFSDTPTFLIVEYDTGSSNPWVPFPIPFTSLQQLFQTLNYYSVIKLNEHSSIYNRAKIYSALITKK